MPKRSTIPIVYINLDTSKSRSLSIRRQFLPLFETVFRFAAVSASQHEVAELKRDLALKNGDIKDGILAVLLSHRGASVLRFLRGGGHLNLTHLILLEIYLL